MAVEQEDLGGARPGNARGWLTATRLFDVLIVLTGAAAVVLAAMGWIAWERPDSPAAYADIAIRSIKVLFLSDIYFPSADPAPGLAEVEWMLTTARSLGTLVAVMAAGRIMLALAATRLIETRIAFLRRRDVAIGSGPAAREYAMAAVGRTVVHVDEGNEVSLHRGHARLPRSGPLLKQFKAARVRAASRLVIDEGDDAETWQTAQLAARRYPRLQVIAHIRDQWLSERLARADETSRLRAFSYAGGVARQIMLAHPPFLLARAMGAPAQHILIHGFGDVGQALLREFMVTSVGPEPKNLMITVVDQEAKRREAEFEGRHPGLRAFADIAFLEGDLRLRNEAVETAVRHRNAQAEICAAYVSMDEAAVSALGVAAALRDRAARLELLRSPIFVCADHGAGLRRVDQGAGRLGPLQTDRKLRAEQLARAQQDAKLCDLRLVAFGSWRDALDGSGLFEPDLDGAAQAFHNAYRKASRDPQPDWKDLSDDFRVSNRRAAAHIRAKTASAGFDLNGWLETGKAPRQSHQLPKAADRFPESDRAFERRMAELEHTRWAIDRVLDGWSHGEPRDNLARRHDKLVPFSQLSQDEQDKDTTVVKVTRAILEAKGEP